MSNHRVFMGREHYKEERRDHKYLILLPPDSLHWPDSVEVFDVQTGEVETLDRPQAKDFLRPCWRSHWFVTVGESQGFLLCLIKKLAEEHIAFQPVPRSDKDAHLLYVSIKDKSKHRWTFTDLQTIHSTFIDSPAFLEAFAPEADSPLTAPALALKRFEALIYEKSRVNMRMTLASTAIHILRASLPQGRFQKLPPRYEDSLRQSGYRGAFCYCKPGEFYTYKYDINGFYVWCLGQPLPQASCSLGRWEDCQGQAHYMVEATWSVKRPLPFGFYTGPSRLIPSGYTDWGCSEFNWYTDHEIEYLREHGAEFTFRRGLYWTSSIRLTPFVKWCQRLRSEYPRGSAPFLLGKLIGNAAYGKLGSSPHMREYQYQESSPGQGWQNCFDAYMYQLHQESYKDGEWQTPSEEKIEQVATVGARLWYRDLVKRYQYQQVHIAAYITAMARVQLLWYAETERLSGNQVVYMDTDSLHLLNPARTLPLDPLQIGSFKIEWAGAVQYVRPKYYIPKDVSRLVVMSGVPKAVASAHREENSVTFTKRRNFKGALVNEDLEFPVTVAIGG